MAAFVQEPVHIGSAACVVIYIREKIYYSLLAIY